MKYTAVLPFVIGTYAQQCLSTCRFNVMTIDNSVNNIGIMASHNIAARTVIREQQDWLICMSASVRFGPPGGMDFIDALRDTDQLVLEGAGLFGWHLIAFRREVLETVGLWDENFTPYGFDDIDMILRFQRAYGVLDGERQLWNKVVGDWSDANGMAHSVKEGRVTANTDRQIDYFMRKWGRHPGDSKTLAWMTPFNDPTRPVSWWPHPRGPLGALRPD